MVALEAIVNDSSYTFSILGPFIIVGTNKVTSRLFLKVT